MSSSSRDSRDSGRDRRPRGILPIRDALNGQTKYKKIRCPSTPDVAAHDDGCVFCVHRRSVMDVFGMHNAHSVQQRRWE